MLIKTFVLKEIKAGKLDLLFRKWRTPGVKKGTLLKTAIGQIEIKDVLITSTDQIKTRDAMRAGYDDLKKLIAKLNSINKGDIYKIKVGYHSPDPRIKARQRTKISAEAMTLLLKKLGRLDRFSKEGKWTRKVLIEISNNPKMKATDLAKRLGYTKDWLKPNIRKLKNLGLTISHEIGYTISPLGKSFLLSEKSTK